MLRSAHALFRHIPVNTINHIINTGVVPRVLSHENDRLPLRNTDLVYSTAFLLLYYNSDAVMSYVLYDDAASGTR